MLFVRNTIALVFFLSVATASYAQLGRPTIIGQRAVSTMEETPVTIQFNHLIVFDLNDFYPNGFTITVYEGKDYSFQNTTVTPNAGFVGTLTVPVSVNDGQYESNKFDLKITVSERENIRPTITGQKPLTVMTGNSITLLVTDFTVSDADNNYPDDFTLKVYNGKDYKVDGTTVTPDDDFVGQLIVEVTVHDGKDESPRFDAIIEVTSAPNVPPVIVGQREITTDEDKPKTIVFADLVVNDPNDDYPQGFMLTLYSGDGYTFAGTTITPAKDFFGTLKVGVSVNDGEDESNVYQLDVVVRPVNDPPVITGHAPLSTYIDTPIDIALQDIFVTDPDNSYPQGFTMKLFNGFNYKVKDNTVTPDKNFLGTLYVPVTVDDGKAESEKFTLEIRVLTAPNVPPGTARLRVQAERYALPLRRPQHSHRESPRQDRCSPHQPGLRRLSRRGRCPLRTAAGDSHHPRQSFGAQDSPGRRFPGAAPPRPAALHPHLFVLAQPSRAVVLQSPA
jgi:hypothetical protein